ncbi:MAG: hypothetical protein VX938_11170, partial [Myxococcota bacterium]|nr:hypothetical protein [Myxococcota bacterium]
MMESSRLVEEPLAYEPGSSPARLQDDCRVFQGEIASSSQAQRGYVEAQRAEQQRQFKEEGYVVLEGVLPPQLVSTLTDYYREETERGAFNRGDNDVPGAFCRYGEPRSEMLLMMLQEKIEVAVGLRLLPTYSYTRVYQRGDALGAHKDRSACEVSVTLTISTDPDRPWPIYLDGSDGADPPREVLLGAGSLLVYRGMELRHWREALEAESQTQVFLHWVDADGPHADLAHDRREGLAFQIGP